MKTTERNENERQLYNSYRWVWDIISNPDDYKNLADYVRDKLKMHQNTDVQTILHFGCGSGCMDYHLKEHFEVTGVDLSKEMIISAKKRNPECAYYPGDMRDFQLTKKYDAVIIPESIDYMPSVQDIRKVYSNAWQLLQKNGLLLVIVGYDPDKFPQNRTTVDDFIDNERVITFIENNYVHNFSDNSFEATFIFLIKEKGNSRTVIDMHKLGLFPRQTWLNEMEKAGFIAELIDHPYLNEIEQDGTFMLLGMRRD
jgi:ubiquinone/menaquinone biosynthesis C-methylase UbiE